MKIGLENGKSFQDKLVFISRQLNTSCSTVSIFIDGTHLEMASMFKEMYKIILSKICIMGY